MAIVANDNSLNHARFSETAINANGLNSSSAFPAGPYSSGSFQVVWSSHSDTSTFELQMSNDGGANWDTVQLSSFTTSGASGSTTFVFDTHLPGSLMRVSVTEADGNASARLAVYFVGKRGR